VSLDEDKPLGELQENSAEGCSGVRAWRDARKPHSSSSDGAHHDLNQESLYSRSAAGSRSGAGNAIANDLRPESDLAQRDSLGGDEDTTNPERSTLEDMPAKLKRFRLSGQLFPTREARSDVGCGLGWA
jgi:hypothetical protein